MGTSSPPSSGRRSDPTTRRREALERKPARSLTLEDSWQLQEKKLGPLEEIVKMPPA
jgi:hypothetical protein